jgi:hypothetical protein
MRSIWTLVTPPNHPNFIAAAKVDSGLSQPLKSEMSASRWLRLVGLLQGLGQHTGVRGMASAHGTATQHTFTRRHSTAALGLGLGMKEPDNGLPALAQGETAKAVVVARRRFMWVRRLQLLVVHSWVMFAEMVGLVESTLAPQSVELPLSGPAPHPAKSHTRCLGPFLFDKTTGDAGCRIVVGFDDGRGLWVAHFPERCSDRVLRCRCWARPKRRAACP